MRTPILRVNTQKLATLILAILALPLTLAIAQVKQETPIAKPEPAKTEPAHPERFEPEQQASKGSVTIGGNVINYDAFAGTLVVHPKDWDDVPQNADKDDKNKPAEASMFYVAYFKSDNKGAPRPVTFLYNGGPGSSTVWLHMGAFGPKRVVTADDTHTPAAPYPVVNNEYSLLDVSDLVFVDAPGTGFSRIAGKDKEKNFYGVDQDAWAFGDFISQFLAKYGRWNSPKYLFGESYGTTRSAVLSNILETERDVDFNGVILLSQILNFSLDSDFPEFNPGVDVAYQLNLPTYAATAWYHHKLPSPHPDLASLLTEVEHFAMNDYALALGAGASLPTSISATPSPPSFTNTPVFLFPISRKPTSALTVENSRRTCRMKAISPPAAWTRVFPDLLLIRSAKRRSTIHNRRQSPPPTSQPSTTMCAKI